MAIINLSMLSAFVYLEFLHVYCLPKAVDCARASIEIPPPHSACVPRPLLMRSLRLRPRVRRHPALELILEFSLCNGALRIYCMTHTEATRIKRGCILDFILFF